jgi:hypothetical protein
LIDSVTRRCTGVIVSSCWQISLAERSSAVRDAAARAASSSDQLRSSSDVRTSAASCVRSQTVSSAASCLAPTLSWVISSVNASTIGQGDCTMAAVSNALSSGDTSPAVAGS